MSQTSQWPLTEDAVRYTTPAFMLQFLENSRLTRACYPTAVGYYPKARGMLSAHQALYQYENGTRLLSA